jgi:FKBP-type peptidyl-prolyl cis-trans isomerase FkpA
MKSVVLALVGLALIASSCNRPPPESPVAAVTTTATPASSPAAALKFEDIVVGTGPKPLFNQVLLIRYTGWLADGRKIDSTEHQPPMQFRLGRGGMIRGWELGIGGGNGIEPMRVGGKRKLTIPPELGYGSEGNGVVPPNATLIFEVELVGTKNSGGFPGS